MVTVGKCCLCFRLSNGGIILGSFGAFSSLLLVIVIGGFLLNYDNFVAQSYEKGAAGDLDNKRVATFLETYKKVVITLMSIYIFLQCISFVSSISLVCGTINKRPKLLIAWLVSQAILTIFWALGSALTNDINMAIYTIVCGYFWICVYSLYKSITLEVFQLPSSCYGIRAV